MPAWLARRAACGACRPCSPQHLCVWTAAPCCVFSHGSRSRRPGVPSSQAAAPGVTGGRAAAGAAARAVARRTAARRTAAARSGGAAAPPWRTWPRLCRSSAKGRSTLLSSSASAAGGRPLGLLFLPCVRGWVVVGRGWEARLGRLATCNAAAHACAGTGSVHGACQLARVCVSRWACCATRCQPAALPAQKQHQLPRSLAVATCTKTEYIVVAIPCNTPTPPPPPQGVRGVRHGAGAAGLQRRGGEAGGGGGVQLRTAGGKCRRPGGWAHGG